MLRTLRTAILAAAASIITAAAHAQASVPQAAREAVVCTAPAARPQAGFDAREQAWTALAPAYNALHFVSGEQATRARLVATIKDVAGRAHVRALDLVLVDGGLDTQFVFADGRCTIATLAADLLAALDAPRRAKLRFVYSTAGGGAAHAPAWLQVGFRACIGSERLAGDTARSFAPFLAAWAAGKPLEDAVKAANRAPGAAAEDAAARRMLVAAGAPLTTEVRSTRRIDGAASASVDRMP